MLPAVLCVIDNLPTLSSEIAHQVRYSSMRILYLVTRSSTYSYLTSLVDRARSSVSVSSIMRIHAPQWRINLTRETMHLESSIIQQSETTDHNRFHTFAKRHSHKAEFYSPRHKYPTNTPIRIRWGVRIFAYWNEQAFFMGIFHSMRSAEWIFNPSIHTSAIVWRYHVKWRDQFLIRPDQG